MNKKSLIASLLLGVAGWFAFRESKAQRSQRMKRMDYSTSAQRMGLRFNERVRDVWRFKWLKINRK